MLCYVKELYKNAFIVTIRCNLFTYFDDVPMLAKRVTQCRQIPVLARSHANPKDLAAVHRSFQ